MPQASVSSGTAPRLEIASTTEITPASLQAATSDSDVGDDAGRGLRMDDERDRGATVGERAGDILGAR